MFRYWFVLFVGVAGCSSGASHIPPVWELPGAVVGSAIGNVRYEAQRTRVKEEITSDLSGLRADILAGEGARLDAVIEMARVKQEKRSSLVAALNQDVSAVPIDDADTLAERLTVTFMVHSD